MTYRSQREWTPAEMSSYWSGVKRQPEHNEVDRLYYVGYFFWKESLEEYESIYEFLTTAKRPFGNKDIAASICYVLGWDHERRLTQPGAYHRSHPEAMIYEEWAAQVFAVLIAEVKDNTSYYDWDQVPEKYKQIAREQLELD